MLRITNIEVFPLKLDKGITYLGESTGAKHSDMDYYQRPEYRSFYSKKLETLMVKVSTSAGKAGWGECLAPVAPEVPAVIIESLFSAFLIGKSPLNIEVIWNELYDSMRERGYFSGFMIDAITAVDIALWDIAGKVYNAPVHQLLGGAYRNKIPAYISGLPNPEMEEKKVLVQQWQQKGFKKVKLHLGYGMYEDVQIIAELKESFPNIEFMVDAHWHYSPKEAIQLSKKLEPYNILFLEAPIVPEDIDGNRLVVENSNIPIAIGEAKRTKYQFKERLIKNSADILQPDVGRAGITETKKIADLAEAFNRPIAPHLSVGQGVCVAATLQVSAAINKLYLLEYQPTVFPTANEIVSYSLVCENGFYNVPNAPGLGVTVDEDKVRYYAVKGKEHK